MIRRRVIASLRRRRGSLLLVAVVLLLRLLTVAVILLLRLLTVAVILLPRLLTVVVVLLRLALIFRELEADGVLIVGVVYPVVVPVFSVWHNMLLSFCNGKTCTRGRIQVCFRSFSALPRYL